RFGRLPMADVLGPAIGYAENGFPVTQLIAHYWKTNLAGFEKNAALIEELDNARATYGPAPAEGQVFRNHDLARSYALLARGGRDPFSKGETARPIDAYMRRIGGALRLADLAAPHGEWVEPLSVNYRGYDVWELPPNGQGAATLQMLQILRGYDLAKM